MNVNTANAQTGTLKLSRQQRRAHARAERKREQRQQRQRRGSHEKVREATSPDRFQTIAAMLDDSKVSLTLPQVSVEARERRLSCPCGYLNLLLPGFDGGPANHLEYHAFWRDGLPSPEVFSAIPDVELPVEADNSLHLFKEAVATLDTQMTIELGLDEPMIGSAETWETERSGKVAMLAIRDGKAVGVLIAGITKRWGLSDRVDDDGFVPLDRTGRQWAVQTIFVSEAYRRTGVGRALLESFAAHYATPLAEVVYNAPFTEAGLRLVRSLVGEGDLRVCKYVWYAAD